MDIFVLWDDKYVYGIFSTLEQAVALTTNDGPFVNRWYVTREQLNKPWTNDIIWVKGYAKT